MKTKILYYLEVGKLRNDLELGFNNLDTVFDKKHNYEDIYSYNSFNEKQTINLAQNILKKSDNNTYIVVSSIIKDFADDLLLDCQNEIIDNGYIEENIERVYPNGEQYKNENVIFSVYKDDFGEITFNFVGDEKKAQDIYKNSLLFANNDKSLKEIEGDWENE